MRGSPEAVVPAITTSRGCFQFHRFSKKTGNVLHFDRIRAFLRSPQGRLKKNAAVLLYVRHACWPSQQSESRKNPANNEETRPDQEQLDRRKAEAEQRLMDSWLTEEAPRAPARGSPTTPRQLAMYCEAFTNCGCFWIRMTGGFISFLLWC